MPGIVAAIREILGKGRFTVIFDRGGFDHRLFKWLDSERIGFVTYQRGRPDLPESSFARKETRFEGRRVRFDLAEDVAWVNGKTHVSPTCELDVHDRVGGGDGFASGFIYGLLSGESAEEALKLGWAHGALLTTTPGDTTMVTLEQVKAFAKGGSARIQR